MRQRYDEPIVLAADVGGTNTNLAVVRLRRGSAKILFRMNEETASAHNFPSLITHFLESAKDEGYEPGSGCFAVAGPVEVLDDRRRVKMTNVPVVVDSQEIREKTSLSHVQVVNDFEAISWGITSLEKGDYQTLNEGAIRGRGCRVVIGAGTGLGKSILYFHDQIGDYVPIPSEGGHADLPLLDQEELDLSAFIKKKRGLEHSVTYEEVLSGRGIEVLYEYLNSTSFPRCLPELSAEEISRSRSENPCSEATFEWFVRFYARCARNLVLDALAKGGLYIAGGIASKNSEPFSQFMGEFVKNDEYEDLLGSIPVKLITNYDVSLLGAARAVTGLAALRRQE